MQNIMQFTIILWVLIIHIKSRNITVVWIGESLKKAEEENPESADTAFPSLLAPSTQRRHLSLPYRRLHLPITLTRGG